jgi:putative glycerol-1-phosphate prenyltransferase
MYGDIEYVKETARVLENSTFFYGGGIKTPQQAKEIAEHADVIVVGNILYEDLGAALKTVEAVK